MPFEALRFASFLVSPTRGTTERDRTAKRIVQSFIKNDRRRDFDSSITWQQFAARRLRESGGDDVHMFLAPNRLLVPMPRSGFLQPGALWPARRLCEYLHAEGFGSGISSLLERRTPIRSSAFSGPGHRPTMLEKYGSLGVARELGGPAAVTIVDDQISKGSEMFAAALRIAEAFPGVDVVGFAMSRTLGFEDNIPDIKAPCTGTITLDGDRVKREP